MKTVNVHEAKTNFSSLLAKLHDLTVVTTDEHFEKYGVTVIC